MISANMGDVWGDVGDWAASAAAGVVGMFVGGPAGAAAAAALAHAGVNALRDAAENGAISIPGLPDIDFAGLSREEAYALIKEATDKLKGGLPDALVNEFGAKIYQLFVSFYGSDDAPKPGPPPREDPAIAEAARVAAENEVQRMRTQGAHFEDILAAQQRVRIAAAKVQELQDRRSRGVTFDDILAQHQTERIAAAAPKSKDIATRSMNTTDSMFASGGGLLVPAIVCVTGILGVRYARKRGWV